MTKLSKTQSGFTIIELVMVIVILGILSAFALPRFADFGQDAREASLAGLAGAMKSAAAIAHAEQLVNSGALGASVSLEGQTITMVNGYPTPNAAGILTAAGITAAEFTLTPLAPVATGGSTLEIAIKAGCSVTYTSADGAGGVDNVGPIDTGYSVTLNTGGCG